MRFQCEAPAGEVVFVKTTEKGTGPFPNLWYDGIKEYRSLSERRMPYAAQRSQLQFPFLPVLRVVALQLLPLLQFLAVQFLPFLQFLPLIFLLPFVEQLFFPLLLVPILFRLCRQPDRRLPGPQPPFRYQQDQPPDGVEQQQKLWQPPGDHAAPETPQGQSAHGLPGFRQPAAQLLLRTQTRLCILSHVLGRSQQRNQL